jgi:LETM1-like protein
VGKSVSNHVIPGDKTSNNINVRPRRNGADPNVESSESPERNNRSTASTTWRPMTIVERIACFPDAARKVWADYLLNQNITDTSTTPLNAWTINHPILNRKRKRQDSHDKTQSTRHSSRAGNFHDETNAKEASKISATLSRKTTRTRVPWRQLQQQRRIQQELRFILPIVALCMPPGIGYITMLLAFGAPRQVLTRHFFNEYETQHFARLEYEQRLQNYEAVARRCLLVVGGTSSVAQEPEEDWNHVYLKNDLNQIVHENYEQGRLDTAGPIIDALPLYLRFFSSTPADASSLGRTTTSTSCRGDGVNGACWSSTLLYSREHLSRLAMAAGAVFPSLPAWLSRRLCDTVAPTSWLSHRIRHRARMVAEDDENLLFWISQQEEGSNNNDNLDPCWSLTEIEVRDACLLRGLPVEMTEVAAANSNTAKITKSSLKTRSLDIHDMRKCLVNHLNMIASVKQRLPVQEHNTEGFGLFTLHLPIIRHFLMIHHPSFIL